MVLDPVVDEFRHPCLCLDDAAAQGGRDQCIIGWVAATLFDIPFQPLEMLYTPGAVLVGMVYEFLPFMILPIFTSLEKIETSSL